MARTAVETTALTKLYDATPALHGIDLHVAPGERIAVFGPNGAGKTTLLRLLALLLRPSSGRLRLGGCTPESAGAGLRRLVGFLGHQSALYPDLTVAENLAFYARLYHLPAHGRRIETVLDAFGLTGRRDVRAGALSRGQLQRLGLARAVLHHPPLLLLDEPETGLDTSGLALLTDLVTGGARTVLFSTHDIEWGCRLAGRALILNAGRIVYDGPTAQLDAATVGASFTLPAQARGPAPAWARVEAPAPPANGRSW